MYVSQIHRNRKAGGWEVLCHGEEFQISKTNKFWRDLLHNSQEALVLLNSANNGLPLAQLVKSACKRVAWVRSLGAEDPWRKESYPLSIPSWRIPWTVQIQRFPDNLTEATFTFNLIMVNMTL